MANNPRRIQEIKMLHGVTLFPEVLHGLDELRSPASLDAPSVPPVMGLSVLGSPEVFTYANEFTANIDDANDVHEQYSKLALEHFDALAELTIEHIGRSGYTNIYADFLGGCARGRDRLSSAIDGDGFSIRQDARYMKAASEQSNMFQRRSAGYESNYIFLGLSSPGDLNLSEIAASAEWLHYGFMDDWYDPHDPTDPRAPELIVADAKRVRQLIRDPRCIISTATSKAVRRLEKRMGDGMPNNEARPTEPITFGEAAALRRDNGSTYEYHNLMCGHSNWHVQLFECDKCMVLLDVATVTNDIVDAIHDAISGETVNTTHFALGADHLGIDCIRKYWSAARSVIFDPCPHARENGTLRWACGNILMYAFHPRFMIAGSARGKDDETWLARTEAGVKRAMDALLQTASDARSRHGLTRSYPRWVDGERARDIDVTWPRYAVITQAHRALLEYFSATNDFRDQEDRFLYGDIMIDATRAVLLAFDFVDHQIDRLTP